MKGVTIHYSDGQIHVAEYADEILYFSFAELIRAVVYYLVDNGKSPKAQVGKHIVELLSPGESKRLGWGLRQEGEMNPLIDGLGKTAAMEFLAWMIFLRAERTEEIEKGEGAAWGSLDTQRNAISIKLPDGETVTMTISEFFTRYGMQQAHDRKVAECLCQIVEEGKCR